MKKLVVYYSMTGNTDFIAKTIADTIKADLLHLKPLNEPKTKNKFVRFFWSGREACMKTKPELEKYTINPEDYGIIFLGTPVWAFTYAPPLRTFISTHKIKNKKIVLFCCHGGAKGKTFEALSKDLEGNEIVSRNDFFEPLMRGREKVIHSVMDWVKVFNDDVS